MKFTVFLMGLNGRRKRSGLGCRSWKRFIFVCNVSIKKLNQICSRDVLLGPIRVALFFFVFFFCCCFLFPMMLKNLRLGEIKSQKRRRIFRIGPAWIGCCSAHALWRFVAALPLTSLSSFPNVEKNRTLNSKKKKLGTVHKLWLTRYLCIFGVGGREGRKEERGFRLMVTYFRMSAQLHFQWSWA